MKPTSNWDEAESQFWEDVKGILTGEYGHNSDQAQKGINKYKQAIRQHIGEGNIPQVVYNQGEEKTAEVVNGMMSLSIGLGAH